MDKNYSHDLITYDSLSQRINQLMMNMERWRWEDVTDEDYTITINIPSYALQFYACRVPVMNSKVIIGKPETPTPFLLDSKVSYFYVYPYWFVPFSIATKEILPILKRDTGYLEKNNMDILDRNGNVMDATVIRWKKYSEEYFPFTIRQRDGDENTLGVLKFIFPNKYGIYLHDTNSHSLFSKEYRALSHGCIRLEKAKELAELITEYCAINFNSDSLQEYVNNKERRRVDLFRPLPIHIRYYTAVADSNSIHFYDDVYSIDKKMNDSFNSNFTNDRLKF
jgi:murein L,D-transpeptidase YcbB/YkuD